ncbi:hypothetical protein Bca101_018796 [Brassica carinata]
MDLCSVIAYASLILFGLDNCPCAHSALLCTIYECWAFVFYVCFAIAFFVSKFLYVFILAELDV